MNPVISLALCKGGPLNPPLATHMLNTNDEETRHSGRN